MTTTEKLSTVIDGMTIISEVSGTPDAAVTILVLHGWGGGLRSMQGVASGLAERGYRIHNLDLPGFGESGSPAEAWGVPDYARLVDGYMHHHQLRRVNLIGHSFGGRISIVMGAEYAVSIGKIVLTSSAGVLPP